MWLERKNGYINRPGELTEVKIQFMLLLLD